MRVFQMRLHLVMAVAAAATLQSSVNAQVAAQQQRPVERALGNGVIAVQVTRVDGIEGVGNVELTLQGPAAVATLADVSALFKPNNSLTAAQRQQIDQTIEAGIRSNAPPETVANSAIRLQAQLLGLPAPNSIQAPRRPPDIKAQTDTYGRFSFAGLPPGRYSVTVEREGYFTATASGTPQAQTAETRTVVVKESEDTLVRVHFSMIRGGILGGIVRDPNGKPVVGITVMSYQPSYQEGRVRFSTFNQGSTDDRGEFRIFWVPPGDYYLAASPRRPAAASPSSRDSWSKTFFPGTIDARAAAPVNVAEGAEVTTINITLRAESKAKISGRIVSPFADAKGKATVPSQQIYLLSRDADAMPDVSYLSFQNAAPNREAGQFEITHVPPGSYELLASALTGPADPNTQRLIEAGLAPTNTIATAWGRARVDVGDADVMDVTVPIKSSTEVHVRVAVDGEPPPYTLTVPAQRGGVINGEIDALLARGLSLADALSAAQTNSRPPVPTPQVRVMLHSPENTPSANNISPSAYDPAGVFTLSNVSEGRYTLQVSQLPQDAYVSDIRHGGASIFDSGLFIDGSLAGAIDVAVSTKGAKVQGSVQTRDDRAAANAMVVLVPTPARRQNAALYKTTRSNELGTFSIGSVAPGEYKLFAWESIPNGAWQNAAFISRYESLGQAITVTAVGTNADLKWIPKDYGR